MDELPGRSAEAPELDVSLIGQSVRVDLLAAYQRRRCALDAAEQRLLHAMASDPRVYPDGVRALDKQWVREDVACVLRLSASTAADRLSVATTLVDRLPATLRSVDEGHISLAHARRLAEAVAPLPDAAAGVVEARVLSKAGTQTLAQFVAACARAVIAADPRSAQQREAAAARERRVVVSPLPDGMAQLLAILPAADAWAIRHILDTAAYSTAADGEAATVNVVGDDTDGGAAGRTVDHRRADALVDLVLSGQRLLTDGPEAATTPAEDEGDTGDDNDDASDASDASDADERVGRETPDGALTHAQRRALTRAESAQRRRARRQGPLFDVTVAASTLAGADDQPAELAGYGPITATTARRLAADPSARFRPLTVDRSGRLLDVGRARYRPPAHIARHVRIESGFCYFPGCRRRSVNCELDHRRDWSDGGATSVENLEAACPRHHHVKHDAGWHVIRLPDRSLRWTSPTGHAYDRPPPDHLPIDTQPAHNRSCEPPPF